MKNNAINYVAVGGFVLLMVAALIVSIALLSGRTGAVDTFYTVYDNVSGVRPGTKVMFQGFPIGQVDRIEPQREPGKIRFRVAMDVVRGWKVPKDSVAQVAASGLLAAVAIDIRGGESGDMLPPGATIPGGSGGNIFAVMTDVANQVSDLSQNALKPLLTTVNRHVDTLGQMLAQQAPELLQNLVAVSSDLATKTPQITSDAQDFAGQLNDAGRQINHILSDGNVSKIDQLLVNLETTSGNAATLSRDLGQSRKRIDDVLTGLNRIVNSNDDTIQQSMHDLRYSLQAVARNIDSVTYNLEGTARNFHEFSRQLRQDPSFLLGGRRSEGPEKR
ncbi:MAG: MlaD family protein [Rhodospirillales bacterium]|nr:MlaD family protein [Rhodospirillales bacterium]